MANGTPESLLKAATEVFAKKGFSGARVDEIAQRAGANKAMIYYYFGPKQELYDAVAQRLFALPLQEVERVRHAEADPLKRLLAFYRGLVRIFGQQRALPQIILREMLAGGRNLGAATARSLAGLLGFVRTTVEEGVAIGRFRRVDPLLVHLTMMAPIAVYFVSEPFRERLAPVALPDRAQPTPEALFAHLEELLTRALAPDPAVGLPHRS